MQRINEIIETVVSYHPAADTTALKRAYVLAAKAHEGQQRLSGEPYLSHPLAVAALLAELRLDVPTVCGGLLHDVVEDTKLGVDDVARIMGPEIASLVEGVTKLSDKHLPEASRGMREAESLRKMILAMAQDIRVLLIKLADRLHNMRTLGYLPEHKRQRVARQTLEIFAPMAHRLGIRKWQAEMEDLAFYYLEPKTYAWIKERVALRLGEREKFIEEVKEILRKEITARAIACRVEGRPKHIYSIYQKMRRRNVDIDELYDLVAFRVITHSVRDCYEVLGIVHNLWTPIPGRFRDYIGMPKPNMYQSLHTTVIGPYGQRMEVQIRTEQMHKIAEEGIAAHWQYKESSASDEAEQRRFAWLRQLLEWQREMSDPSDFLQSLRVELYPEEIFVFTPTGEVKELPKGATPVDFAYAIHTEVGHHCVGAKVNGRIVSLRTQLKTGDQVEIITNPNHAPSKDWLKFVVSPRARAKIRAYFREAERAQAVNLGRQLLEKELRKREMTVSKALRNGSLEEIAREFSFTSSEHLLAAISYGKISPRQVANRLCPQPDSCTELPPQAPARRRRASEGGVRVRGVEDVLVRFARCCNPLPGEPIVGYITRGKGVSVHAAGCKMIKRAEPERLVEVEWDTTSDEARPVRIRVVNDDRVGMLADITQVIKTHGVHIATATARTTAPGRAVAEFVLHVKSSSQLKDLMNEIRKVGGVVDVRRVGAGLPVKASTALAPRPAVC